MSMEWVCKKKGSDEHGVGVQEEKGMMSREWVCKKRRDLALNSDLDQYTLGK